MPRESQPAPAKTEVALRNRLRLQMLDLAWTSHASQDPFVESNEAGYRQETWKGNMKYEGYIFYESEVFFYGNTFFFVLKDI